MSANPIYSYFAKWIENETGIIYADHNLYQLQDRLEQLMRHFHLSSLEELQKKAEAGISGEFRQILVDISTNNETSFFRDPKFFDCLEKKILPALILKCGMLAQIKIWSVASSTGQEPYSVAMILNEMSQRLDQPPPHILATDIAEKVLKRARVGHYTDIEIGRGLSPEQKKRYFNADINGGYTLDSKIRSMVDFQKLNLRSHFSMNRQFDLILCRNVLIYQRVPAKCQIIAQLTSHLKTDGVLLLGSGESLIGLSDNYRQTLIDGVPVYKKINLEAIAS